MENMGKHVENISWSIKNDRYVWDVSETTNLSRHEPIWKCEQLCKNIKCKKMNQNTNLV